MRGAPLPGMHWVKTSHLAIGVDAGGVEVNVLISREISITHFSHAMPVVDILRSLRRRGVPFSSLHVAAQAIRDGRARLAEAERAAKGVEVGLLPNGHTLFRRPNAAGGHTYITDEVPGGCEVWDTALVGRATLLLALVAEDAAQFAEAHAKEKVDRSARGP